MTCRSGSHSKPDTDCPIGGLHPLESATLLGARQEKTVSKRPKGGNLAVRTGSSNRLDHGLDSGAELISKGAPILPICQLAIRLSSDDNARRILREGNLVPPAWQCS
jgi:hypothetical protein